MSSQQQSPKISIVIAIITAITGLGVALFNNWDKLVSASGNPKNSELSLNVQKVKFILLDSSGNPITLARVQFIFDGAPEPRYTDDSGYVSISIPKREEVRVLIHKEGFKPIRREMNLNADTETTAEYIMYSELAAQPNNLGDDRRENSSSQESDDERTKEEQESSGTSEANNILGNVNSSQSSIMDPLDFFDLYFHRVDHGLYEEAFQMFSQDYMAKIYYSRGFSFNSALENYTVFWDRCDMEYKDKSVVLNAEEAVIFYQRRYFCKDDHAVGRKHNFQSQKMVLIKSLGGHEWKIKEVVAAQ